MSTSWDDERLASLVGDGGESGLALYGAYWRVAEIVALQMEGATPSCSVSYSIWRWAQKLSIRKSYARSILVRLQKESLLVVDFAVNSDETTTVKMPNLLKYRDEYSKKSRQTPDNVPPRTEGDKEGEQIEEKREEKVENLDGSGNFLFAETQEQNGESPQPKKPEVWVDLWNKNRGILPEIRKITSDLTKEILARSKEYSDEEFTDAVQMCALFPFTKGENDRGWKATLAWLLRGKTSKNDGAVIGQVLNGKYGERPRKAVAITWDQYTEETGYHFDHERRCWLDKNNEVV